MERQNTVQISKKQRGWHRPETLVHAHSARPQKSLTQGLFHRGWLEPAQGVANGEMAVSLLQVATQGMGHIQEHLQDMEAGLLAELRQAEAQPLPDESLKPFVHEMLAKISALAEETLFKGQGLLNGKLGLISRGKSARVLAGPPLARRTPPQAIRVEVLKRATRSVLTGSQILTDSLIRQESQIILSENDHVACYEILPNETVESLLEGLQKLVIQKGLDLEIQQDAQGHLQIQHCQYGSPFMFSGRSLKTTLVSQKPNILQFCRLGANCIGRIAGHFVQSRGHLLLCEKQVPHLEGMAVLWQKDSPGQDDLWIENRALPVTLGADAAAESWIFIDSCHPKDLACGVQNRSDFKALSDLVPTTWQSVYDALYLVQLSLLELAERRGFLEAMQHQFEQATRIALERVHLSEPVHSLAETTAPAGNSPAVNRMAKVLQKAFLS